MRRSAASGRGDTVFSFRAGVGAGCDQGPEHGELRVGRRLGDPERLGNPQRPAGAARTSAGSTPGCTAVSVSSQVSGSGSSTPRSVMTSTGPRPRRPSRSRWPGPSPYPTEVTKSTRSTKVRWLCRTHHEHLAARRGDLRCAARAGQAHVGAPVVGADDGRVDVAEPVELGGAEEADVDAAGLEPVVEDLRHADDRVGGLGQLTVADGQRQPVGLARRSCPDS